MKNQRRPEQDIGLRVRELREARGWTQRQLAEQMKRRGFDWMQTTVAKTETATRPIRYDEVFALAVLVFEEGLDALVFERSRLGNLRHALLIAEDLVEQREADVADAERDLNRLNEALVAATKSRDAARRAVEKAERRG